MKRSFVFILSALNCLLACSQVPAWMDAEYREAHYSADLYYSGFAVSELRGNESLDEAYTRVRLMARVELVSSIRLSVHSETQNDMINRTLGPDIAHTEETFRAHSVQKTGADNIPGVSVEVYQDIKTRSVCAFAFVEKKGLGRKLEKQLTSTLSKIELKLEDINENINNGKKEEARRQLLTIPALYDIIEETQQNMLAIDETLTKEDLQMDEYHALRAQVNALNTSIGDGNAIYIRCNATIFGSPYASLRGAIEGGLSEDACYFVESEDSSDWSVAIDAYAEEYRQTTYGNVTTYATNVIATVSITKKVNDKIVYKDEVTAKGTHTINFKEAAKDGYRALSRDIIMILKQQIK